MAVDRKRLLDLALGRLEAERARIDQEINDIRSELSGSGTAKKAAKKTKRRKLRLSAAERKARSERMKKYWRDRKKAKK